MAEKPIIFSTPMVQAIMAGRKTQTRRAVNAPVLKDVRAPNKVKLDADVCHFIWHGDVVGGFTLKPPYHPGDILWVREGFRLSVPTVDVNHNDGAWSASVEYRADNILGPRLFFGPEGANERFGWRSPIHMPRKAARLFLRVTDMRVERLQGISEADAKAEGVGSALWYMPYGRGEDAHIDISHMPGYPGDLASFRNAFATLWDALNFKRGYGWEVNPWVFAYTFEVIEDASD